MKRNNRGFGQTSWESINWTDVASKVIAVQTIIFEACQIGNINKVHEYQNALINMTEAKLLSIRKVTQDNRRKRTAGIDKVRKLNSKQRLEILNKVNIDGKTSAIQRVWIPKPGKTEKRPLGIPTILDRIKQQLVKLAVEPQWEAKFEYHSYGFRPGGSYMDAIRQVQNCLKNEERFILDANISKCFDRINHDYFVKKVNSSSKISKQIYAWLKAGIMDPDISSDPITNDLGTPQGGVISPLLLNIALHGMEEAVKSGHSAINKKVPKGEKNHRVDTCNFIRYADDFVFIHPSHFAIIEIKKIVSEFLAEMDLELNEEKTKIGSSLNEIKYNHEIMKPGFEFLGAFFQLVPSKSSTVKKANMVKTMSKLKTVPSNNAIRRHLDEIKSIIKKSRGMSQSLLINILAPKINNWSLYYGYIHSSRVFSYCDHKIFQMLSQWCRLRHRNMGVDPCLRKYFIKYKGGKWVFGLYIHETYPKVLPFHAHRKIENFSKIRGDFSPFSPEHIIKVQNFKQNKALPTTEGCFFI